MCSCFNKSAAKHEIISIVSINIYIYIYIYANILSASKKLRDFMHKKCYSF